MRLMICSCSSISSSANTSAARDFGSIRNTTTVRSGSSSSINKAISTSFNSRRAAFSWRYFFSSTSSSNSSINSSKSKLSIVSLDIISLLHSLYYFFWVWRQKDTLKTAVHIMDRIHHTRCLRFRVGICLHLATSTFHYVFTSFLIGY